MNKGFTLLEVLISVLVIGIVASIVLINNNDEAKKQSEFVNIKAKWAMNEGKYIEKLVGKWSFDEGIGIVAGDSSTFNHNGTLQNGPAWKDSSECISGGCLYFDGVNDYISVGTIPSMDFSESFTVGVWANLSVFSDLRSNCGNKRANIFTIGNNPSGVLELGTITSNRFYVTIRTTSVWIELITPGNINQWTYLSLINDKNNNQIKLFVNGEMKSQASYTALMSNKGSARIGGTTPNCSYGYSKGLIDELAIYNYPISLAKIQNEYILGLDNLLEKRLISQEDYDKRVLAFNQFELAEN